MLRRKSKSILLDYIKVFLFIGFFYSKVWNVSCKVWNIHTKVWNVRFKV